MATQKNKNHLKQNMEDQTAMQCSIPNIPIAYEVNHSLNSKSTDKEGSMSIKLDMSKAFDRVEWHFLKGMKLALDFHPSFINLISSCCFTVSYSFRLNGVQFGYL